MNIFGFKLERIKDVTGSGSNLGLNQINRTYNNKSLYLQNLHNKIKSDLGLISIQHLEKKDNGIKVLKSDLEYIFNIAPNNYQNPIIFWGDVVEEMLTSGYAFVIPTYDTSMKIDSLTLLKEYEEMRITTEFIEYTMDFKKHKVRRSNILIFKNPKYVPLDTLDSVIRLINQNLNNIEFNMSEASSVNALIKFPFKIQDELGAKRAKKRIDTLFDIAKNGGVGFLEKDEEFQELAKNINSLNAETIDFLKNQLYDAYGLNEDLFNCNYSEQQWQAYYHTVLQPFVTVFQQELNYKLITKTSRTQGKLILVKLKEPSLVTMKDYAEAAFKLKYSGTFNNNEIRDIKDYPPYEGGDVFETNANAVQIMGGGEKDE